ncbi:MAG: hypothetical protein JNM84_07540 [Planctomycetes bacterium]|nr:hypothetical protein [Planctomycetota bacterium]
MTSSYRIQALDEVIFHTLDRAMLVELALRVQGTRARNEPFFARRRAVALGEAGTELWLASAEDTILDLLRCSPDRPESGEPSWRDLLGVLKAQGPTLDLAALAEEAERRGRAAVWPRALIEAGLAEPT